MPSRTPRRVRRWALRTLYITGPMALVAAVLWTLAPASHLMYGAALLLTLVSVNASTVAVLSHGQVATAQAFAAGYNTGLAVAEQRGPQDNGGGPQPARLRVVE